MPVAMKKLSRAPEQPVIAEVDADRESVELVFDDAGGSGVLAVTREYPNAIPAENFVGPSADG